MSTKLENIKPLIWIEEWNWKPIKLSQKNQSKILEIQIRRTKLKNIISDKLRFNDEIEK